MSLLKSHTVNKLDNFIGGWYLDEDICDTIIEYHKKSENKHEGNIGFHRVDKTIKDSIDVSLRQQDDIYGMYVLNLQKVVDEYVKMYPSCNCQNPWTILEPINIQQYEPGGGYHAWHTERVTTQVPCNITRHLVFMTYLNDVTDGGETEFYHQKLKIKPEKGLTLVWPTDWTFQHRGVVSPTQEKYIITGWFNYVDRPDGEPL